MLQTFLRGKRECKFSECWNSTVLKRGAVSAKWSVFMWGRANEKQNTSFNSDGTEQNCDWVQIAGLIQFVRRQVIRFQLVCHDLQWSGRLKLLESKALLSSNYFHTNLLIFFEIHTTIKSHSLMLGTSNFAILVFAICSFHFWHSLSYSP